MKSQERLWARQLRSEGLSINEIVQKTGFTKSSVSLWVRSIVLTGAQKKRLLGKGRQLEDIEKRRNTRLTNERLKRQVIIDAAKKQISSLSIRELWLIGIMLYWAEGGKTQRGLVRFSNGDPEMIKIMMKFFKIVCNIPEEKIKGHIHIHSHLNTRRAEQYWSSISGIPLNRFYKTYNKPNKASKYHKGKDSLPYGTFDTYICNTELFLKICGWSQAIFSSSIGNSHKRIKK